MSAEVPRHPALVPASTARPARNSSNPRAKADPAPPNGELAEAILMVDGQSEGAPGRTRPDLLSFHRPLDDHYRRAFTGEWQPYAINGTFCVLAGVAALLFHVLFDGAGFAYAGAILAVRGSIALIFTLISPRRFPISLCSAFLYLSSGICLMGNIFIEPISLIWFFSAYFISTGIATILFAVSYRRRYSGPWEWLLVSGVLNLELALISLSRLPEHFIWTLTIFLGLDFIAHGSALLAVALGSKGEGVAA